MLRKFHLIPSHLIKIQDRQLSFFELFPLIFREFMRNNFCKCSENFKQGQEFERQQKDYSSMAFDFQFKKKYLNYLIYLAIIVCLSCLLDGGSASETRSERGHCDMALINIGTLLLFMAAEYGSTRAYALV
ncbi:hypothetical protein BpHYR1_045629 [Brachionus plicatilis]|uniref:Uncharacterized protein n=1 Tax=Brachionus plicatilis TaxID=10195 RepID=A0A3M7QSR7_BRAPC|nr:hypothetical protein BpHYR1_045629 [Brachionus plicatilis]